MKKLFNIFFTGTIIMLCCSCNSFLEEKPRTFLTSSEYYTTRDQIQAAVNGTYVGLSRLLNTDIEIATVRIFNLEYLVGNCYRPRPAGYTENQFLLLSGLNDNNNILREFWRAIYIPVENCNSVIENIEASKVIKDSVDKQRLLGEVYFLRAYYYFFGVRLFGEIPLKIKATKNLENVQIPKASIADIYSQIIKDLKKAEASGLPWTDKSGHVTTGAVKTLLAKVYLTMAGYPLQKGKEYYQKAFQKTKEVIDSRKFNLFDKYSDLRNPANENAGGFIFMIQRERQNAGNPFHFSLLPYPEASVSVNPGYGGGLAPRKEFYDSYDPTDIRKEAFFYTRLPKYGDSSTMIKFNTPYIRKYWDNEAEITGKSGANIPIYRYADVLLMCAEAKAEIDGGTTSDAVALNAYYQVHHRALPEDNKPTSVTVDQVLKERYWELCFEFKNWFDMLRTRKAFDPKERKMVDLIGYKASNHKFPFKESDLLLPIPLREKELNPLLTK